MCQNSECSQLIARHLVILLDRTHCMTDTVEDSRQVYAMHIKRHAWHRRKDMVWSGSHCLALIAEHRVHLSLHRTHCTHVRVVPERLHGMDSC